VALWLFDMFLFFDDLRILGLLASSIVDLAVNIDASD
jgi:hypothetical protein